MVFGDQGNDLSMFENPEFKKKVLIVDSDQSFLACNSLITSLLLAVSKVQIIRITSHSASEILPDQIEKLWNSIPDWAFQSYDIVHSLDTCIELNAIGAILIITRKAQLFIKWQYPRKRSTGCKYNLNSLATCNLQGSLLV